MRSVRWVLCSAGAGVGVVVFSSLFRSEGGSGSISLHDVHREVPPQSFPDLLHLLILQIGVTDHTPGTPSVRKVGVGRNYFVTS